MPCISYPCEVVFSLQPVTYASDRAKVVYVVSLLTSQGPGLGSGILGGGS